MITQQTGWIPGTAPPAQYDNYFKNLVCQWIAYLADLNNQLFTDAGVGAWSQPHVFDAGVTATNTSGPAITATGSGMSPAILATAGEIVDALSITAGNHIATVTQEAQAITTAAGQTPSSGTTKFFFAIPDGATLTGVAVWINSTGTHTSWPPFDPASATIVRWTIDGGVALAVTGGGITYDPAANVAASNAGRAIAFTITGEPAFDRATTLYYVLFGQESGAGSWPETITGIVVYYTPSRLSPAPV